jgi:hypothetical protein
VDVKSASARAGAERAKALLLRLAPTALKISASRVREMKNEFVEERFMVFSSCALLPVSQAAYKREIFHILTETNGRDALLRAVFISVL